MGDATHPASMGGTLTTVDPQTIVQPAERATREGEPAVLFDVRDLSVRYGASVALNAVSMEIYRNRITAFIG
ncbi:MAG: hypothetical protein ACE5EV_07305, partial [Gaiellales bacterium]